MRLNECLMSFQNGKLTQKCRFCGHTWELGCTLAEYEDQLEDLWRDPDKRHLIPRDLDLCRKCRSNRLRRKRAFLYLCAVCLLSAYLGYPPWPQWFPYPLVGMISIFVFFFTSVIVASHLLYFLFVGKEGRDDFWLFRR